MSSTAQAQTHTDDQPLDAREVKIQLVLKGWTQARLAKEIKKSLTTTNLTINHNTYPDVTPLIRKALKL